MTLVIPLLLIVAKFCCFTLKATVNKMQSTCSVRGDLSLEVDKFGM